MRNVVTRIVGWATSPTLAPHMARWALLVWTFNTLTGYRLWRFLPYRLRHAWASARTKWWRPGTTTLLDPYDMHDRFETVEPAPQIDTELAEAFAAVRALR